MMQRLIDPMIEYEKLTNKEEVERLNEVIQTVIKIHRKVTLEYFTIREDKVNDVYATINSITHDSVKLTVYGELCRSNSDFASNAARKWYEYFIIAARNYQKTYELARKLPEVVNQSLLYQYLFMATAEFHNAMQHACSYSLAHDAFEILKSLEGNGNEFRQQINYKFNNIVLKFFASDFTFLNDNVPALSAEVKNILETNDMLTAHDVCDISCILYTLSSLENLTKFVLAGDRQAVQQSLLLIANATDFADKSGRPDLRYIVNKIRFSIETLKELSIWNLFEYFDVGTEGRKAQYLRNYIQSKILNGFLFLYPSQYESLQNGILDNDAKKVLISTPTGSGKTLPSELMILKIILSSLDNNNGLAVYMVPSRALAREKFGDFRLAFSGLSNPEIRVCQVTGEVILDAKRAVMENDVLIVTPEKFDMILRERFYGKDVHIFIIDEFHNIRTGYRGIRIEFSLLRFLQMFPRCKAVLISAIVSNFEEIRKWFNANKDFQSTWRPTFARIGIFDIKEPDNIIKFTDGISVEVELKGPKLRANAYAKQASRLALEFVKEGSCMIFSSSKASVTKYAEHLLEEVQRTGASFVDPQKNEKYATLLKRIVGESEDIYKFFIHGIGVHRGDMPHVIRKIVEGAVRENAISFLVSTTTLAEGINLPLRTIIIPKPKVGYDEMPFSLFFNLFGRSGRPWKEIEGQVIFLARKDYPRDVLMKYETATIKDIERIVTPIAHIIRLERKIDEVGSISEKDMLREQLEIFKAVLDTQLLAALVEKAINRVKDNAELLDRLLIGSSDDKTNLSNRKEIEKALSEAHSRLINDLVVKETEKLLEPTEFGLAVYKTGFSPTSCRTLMGYVPNLVRLFDSSEITLRNILQNYDVLRSIFSLMMIPVETKAYFSGEPPPNYVSIIHDWMRGKLVNDIASKYFGAKVSDTLVSVDGLLAGYTAWFTYALLILVNHYFVKNDRKDARYMRALRALPMYCYYGTNNALALEILQRDVSRELFRDDVLRFVTGFRRKEVSGFLEEPRRLITTQVTQRIKVLGLQTEEDEFINTLHRILA